MKQPFERAVQAHGDAVWRVCRGMLRHDDAEDAWSEAFLAALRAWPALDETADVRAWLVTIAYRKAIDVIRAAARLTDLDAAPEGRSSLGVPEGRDLDLWRALALLPDRERVPVVQHHLAGVPFRAVAEAAGSTPAAARKAASDGIRRLRTLMEEDR